ncbi:PASTA domain-containing protein [Xylanibacter ruminicola]|jgi:beta-lactam-binding protein with PASTA domain|uniref:PASTA domain-containing protein n=1 Tax=Xylanibacter ruminicola TaxID=839 RepID=A0A1H5XM58_XYLRU|nr:MULTISPECIES: PASTA domain-containing protein [Prevotellaceae]MCR5471305.1 PASTA domain-containing protein [Prevotella sp.]SEG12723.1 PASTA domain-containing protein [Xylanibacter ruminicola]
MKAKDFFGKFCSKFLLGHLLAMLLVVIALVIGVKYGLDWYTHHGEGIEVAKVEGMLYKNAYSLMTEDGLNIVVSDSGYNKQLPADCILSQNPGPGTKVKSGHTIYVTVNSPSSPSFAIPDVVDNSSYREAEAKLMALGFKLLPPKLVEGEKDWVYGILCRGRRVSTGDHVSIESPLTLMIGSGTYDSDEEIDYIEPEYQLMLNGDVDDFEEVTE